MEVHGIVYQVVVSLNSLSSFPTQGDVGELEGRGLQRPTKITLLSASIDGSWTDPQQCLVSLRSVTTEVLERDVIDETIHISTLMHTPTAHHKHTKLSVTANELSASARSQNS